MNEAQLAVQLLAATQHAEWWKEQYHETISKAGRAHVDAAILRSAIEKVLNRMHDKDKDGHCWYCCVAPCERHQVSCLHNVCMDALQMTAYKEKR